jgi:hypothetical protein
MSSFFAAGHYPTQTIITATGGLAAVHQSGQTFIIWPDQAQGALGNQWRYSMYRATVAMDGSNYRSVGTLIASNIFNNSAQLFGGNPDTGGATFTQANRQDPAGEMARLTDLGTPVAYATGIQVYTALATADAYYAIEANTNPTGGANVFVGAIGPIHETVATIRPIKVRDSLSRTSGSASLFRILTPTGKPLICEAHASSAAGGAAGNSTIGSYYAWWFDTLGGYQDGMQTAMLVSQPSTLYQANSMQVAWRDTLVQTDGSDGGVETFHFGPGCTPNPLVGVAGRMYNSTEDRILAMIAFVLGEFAADSNQVHWRGTSMGAWGGTSVALRHPSIFASVWANFPLFRMDHRNPQGWTQILGTKPFSAANSSTPLGNDPAAVLLRDGTVWGGNGGYADIPNYIATHVGELPWYGWGTGKHDSFGPWTDHLAGLAAFKAAKRGFAFGWHSGAHETSTSPIQGIEWESGSATTRAWCYSKSLFALNKSYPAFLNSSIDDDPGTGTLTGGEYDGDILGMINAGFTWTTPSDTTNGWSTSIGNNFMARSPTTIPQTTLALPLTATATSLQVTSNTGFPSTGANFDARIGNEQIRVNTIPATTTWSSITRGLNGTTAASHLAGDAVRQSVKVPTGPNRGPFTTMTVDVVVRNVQSFPRTPGTSFNYTYTPFGGTAVTGSGTLDSSGVARVNGVVINSSGGTSFALSLASSMDVVNSGATASPADSPKVLPQIFPRGVVPSGSRKRPYVNGVALSYQADERTFWDDGSLMKAVYRVLMPSIAAGGTATVDFITEAGAFDNSSAGVITGVTGASDFKVALTNMHEARATYTSTPEGLTVALRQSAGAISAAVLKIPASADTAGDAAHSFGTLAVSGGGGTSATLQLNHKVITGSRTTGGSAFVPGDVGATLTSTVGGLTIRIDSIAAGAVTGQTILNGGSFASAPGALSFTGGTGTGFTFTPSTYLPVSVDVTAGGSGFGLKGSGSWSAAFSDTPTLTEQYSKGPVCDAWRRVVPFKDGATAHPFLVAILYIERWKTAAGAFLDFKATAKIHYGVFDTSTAQPCYTFDIDWKNGSTVLRGTTNGDAGFSDYVNFVRAACFTLDSHGQMDWTDTTNGPKWNALYIKRSATQIAQFKNAGVLPPILNITPTQPAPTYENPYATGNATGGGAGGWGGSFRTLPLYQPGYYASCEVSLSHGGTHNNLGLIAGGIHVFHHLTQDAAWLRSLRCNAAASALLTCNMMEPATGLIPNVIPAAVQAFTGMADRSTVSEFSLGTQTGQTNRNFGQTTVDNDPSHWPAYQTYAYLVEGERWMLDQLVNNAGHLIFVQTSTNRRQATLTPTGGAATTYYGLCGLAYPDDARDGAWALREVGYAAKLLPVTRADGTAEVQQAYLKFVLQQNIAFMNAVVSLVGTVKIGSSGTTVTKSDSWASAGLWDMRAVSANSSNRGADTVVPFMENYLMQSTAQLSKLWPEIPGIAQFANHFIKTFVGRMTSFSPYYADSYRQMALQTTSGTPIATWANLGDPSNPTNGVMPQAGSNFATASFSNGSATMTLSAAPIINGAAMADGTRVRLTNTDTTATQLATSGEQVPTPFDEAVWYFWKGLTSLTGQLCTDAALALPVTATQDKAGVSFWIVPANPRPSVSAGSFNGGSTADPQHRMMEIMATLRLAKAAGLVNSSLDAAIANAVAINAAVGSSYVSDPNFAYDQTY